MHILAKLRLTYSNKRPISGVLSRDILVRSLVGQERAVVTGLPGSLSCGLSPSFLDPIRSFCYHHLQDPVLDRKSPCFSLRKGNNLWNCLIIHMVLRCYHAKVLGFDILFSNLQTFCSLWSREQLWVQEVTAPSSLLASLQRRRLQSFEILRETFNRYGAWFLISYSKAKV